MSAERVAPLLAIDTATSRTIVAVEHRDGRLVESSWLSGLRHGEELLAGLDRLLVTEGLSITGIRAIAVGTGPGAFTGLRVGLATAKGLAHALAIPIIGIPTSSALVAPMGIAGEPAPAGTALLLPAGPRDRVLVDADGTHLLPAGTEPDLAPEVVVVAVDLDGRAPADALARGAIAQAGLGSNLLRLAGQRLARGLVDDLARLVPEYVSLPRGVTAIGGSIEWSRDPR